MELAAPEHVSPVESGPNQQPWLGVDAAQGETPYELRSDNQQAPTQALHPAGPHDSPVTSTDGAARLDSRTRIISTQVDNPAHALDLLTFATSEEQHSAAFPPPEQGGAAENLRGSISQEDNGRPDGLPEHDLRWHYFKFVQQRLIAVHEAIEFIDFFFSCLWPLRPVVPAYYNDRSKYVLLAVEEPVLLEAIITLASRYHVLSGNHGQIRSERIHWGAWRSLQKCLQSAMWGSTKTRSLGTIASMLLLIDWHSKAINNPGAFSSEDDSFACDMPPDMPESDSQESPTSLNSKQRHGMTTRLENLGITFSAYRSNKMSWMLLANAIALAREGCYFEIETRSLLDSINNDKTANRDWAHVICVFIYLADEHLALRLDLEPLLPESSRKIVVHRLSKMFTRALPEKEHWESYFELTEEMRKAREYLHELKQTASRPYSYDLVPILEYTQRRLERWKRQFERLDQSSLLSACLSIEFGYAVIYSLSPVGYVTVPENIKATSNVQSLRHETIQAARNLLSLVSGALDSSGMLQYIPVRCWVFTMAASLHLLKETLRHEPNVTNQDPDIQLLRRAVEALRRGAPDDVHTAGRYSQFIGILLDAVLRSSANRAESQEEAAGPAEATPRAAEISDLIHVNVAFDLPLNDVTWWNDAWCVF
ncbi:zinc finger transcriptional activator [Fusarium falciforme]